jgi:exopolysaccharide production protein ExoY
MSYRTTFYHSSVTINIFCGTITPLMESRILGLHHSSLSGKRVFDILFSLGLLALLSPLFLLIGLMIRLSSRGQIIYAHERLGLYGKTFKCYKFRTMVTDAEEILSEVLKQNPDLKKEWKTTQKLRKDPRVLKIGKFLRKSSLDELPQLWNVLMGEMSLVGPRPYALDQKIYLGREIHQILSIKPGLTGLWQTSGRSSLPFHQRIELDCKYVETRSFLSDTRLILKTIPTLLFAKDAY